MHYLTTESKSINDTCMNLIISEILNEERTPRFSHIVSLKLHNGINLIAFYSLSFTIFVVNCIAQLVTSSSVIFTNWNLTFILAFFPTKEFQNALYGHKFKNIDYTLNMLYFHSCQYLKVSHTALK